MSDSLALKRAAANAALEIIGETTVLGIGTGSTVEALIELLVPYKARLEATIASSVRTEKALRARGFSCCRV